jgi:hypothetical protein
VLTDDAEKTMDQIVTALQVSRSALWRQLGPALKQEQADQAALPAPTRRERRRQ